MNVQNQLSIIESECNRFQASLGELEQEDWPTQVRCVVRHLHAHLFDHDLQIGDVCDCCGVNSSHFQLQFKCHCHNTMHCYCEEKRMLAALRLLKIRELDIGLIAFEIGYTNYRTFGRAFKRFFGATPSGTRQNLATLPQEPDFVPAGMSQEVFRQLVSVETERGRQHALAEPPRSG